MGIKMAKKWFVQIEVIPNHCPFCGKDIIPYCSTYSRLLKDQPLFHCNNCNGFCHIIPLELRVD